jgi:hypothetical protein
MRENGQRTLGEIHAPSLIRLQSRGKRVWWWRLKTYLRLIVVVIALFPALARARDPHEQKRITFLLETVETTEGVTFIRNGSEYKGVKAADHLRRKLDYSGERLKTAEDFIRYCATESSRTHHKYQVRTSDGKTEDAAVYFTSLLRQFDQGQKP